MTSPFSVDYFPCFARVTDVAFKYVRNAKSKSIQFSAVSNISKFNVLKVASLSLQNKRDTHLMTE